MSKKFRLSHQPLPSTSKAATYKEELEMAKDLVLVDILAYDPKEMADFVRSGLISMDDIEKANIRAIGN